MKLLLENLPPSLHGQRETLARCLEAMDHAMPLKVVYLFGSHARGEARIDSDVDLCLVTEGAAEQLKAAQRFRHAIWNIRPKPAFTLVPIAPRRLEEKKAMGDYFFGAVLAEGVPLATQGASGDRQVARFVVGELAKVIEPTFVVMGQNQDGSQRCTTR